MEQWSPGIAQARRGYVFGVALASVTSEQLQDSWTLKADGHALFTLPKAAVLRSFVFDHNVYHRAQMAST